MNLRRVFADICRGYSVTQWRGKPAYIKHLTHFDQVDIDEVHDAAKADAIRRGIKTEEERLKWLADRKMWVIKDEIALRQQRDYVKGLQISKTKYFSSLQIDAINATLKVEQEKLAKMMAYKEGLIDLTAEHVADRKVQFTYISQTFFSDPDLRNPLFTDRDVRRMDDDETAELLDLYIDNISQFSTPNVRAIAVAGYFTDLFYLCGEDTTAFFKRPICELTAQQASLISHGLYFKSIVVNNDIPDDIRGNPDRLEEYVNRSSALKKVLANTSESGRVGLVGTSSDDFKALGLRNDTATMQETVGKQYQNGMKGATDLGYTVR